MADATSHGTFFKGKTVRIIVGYAAGGDFDACCRTIARHLGRHIPGHPAVISDDIGRNNGKKVDPSACASER